MNEYRDLEMGAIWLPRARILRADDDCPELATPESGMRSRRLERYGGSERFAE